MKMARPGLIFFAGDTPGAGEITAAFGEYSATLGFTTLGDQPRPENITSPDGK